jgi:hypothetical protein
MIQQPISFGRFTRAGVAREGGASPYHRRLGAYFVSCSPDPADIIARAAPGFEGSLLMARWNTSGHRRSARVNAPGRQEILQMGCKRGSGNTTPHSREPGFGLWVDQRANERPPWCLTPQKGPPGAVFDSLPA